MNTFWKLFWSIISVVHISLWILAVANQSDQLSVYTALVISSIAMFRTYYIERITP